LPLAHALKQEKPECRIIYIGLRGDKLEGLQARYKIFDEVHFITSGKFRRYHGESFLAHLIDLKTLLLNLRDFFRLIKGFFHARRLLKQIQPSDVFSKGGFVVVPVGMAAHFQRIPIITHDSDAVPGLANRLIGRWAKVHATGLSAHNYPYPKESIFYTGIPIDERISKTASSDLEASKQALDVPKDDLVILVGGAGLGSLTINNKMVASATAIFNKYPQLHIFHITGSQHEADVKQGYANVFQPAQLTRVRVMGFTPEFYKFSAAADLVITRAGATTIAELAAQGRPTILIPAPFLTGGQQLKNATELESKKAAVVLPNDVTVEQLSAKIIGLLGNKTELKRLSSNISKLARPEAAAELANLIVRTAEG